MDLDKTTSKIFINYFMEETKIVIKIPLKNDEENKNNNLIVDKFDFSNKIFLTNID